MDQGRRTRKNNKVEKTSIGRKNIKTGSQQAAVPYEVTGKGPSSRFSAGHEGGEGKAGVQPWAIEQAKTWGQCQICLENFKNYFYMGGRGIVFQLSNWALGVK